MTSSTADPALDRKSPAHDPVISAVVGDVDWDMDEISRRYAHERDARLRPDNIGQYVETAGEFAHFSDDPHAEPVSRAPLTDEVDAVVVGGGIGGTVTAVNLRKAGFAKVRVIDKAVDFGGTWSWNRYPGVRCDTEAYIYLPLLEDIDTVPTEKYARGEEIQGHFQALATTYGLYDDACFQTAVTGATWDEDRARWTVETDRGDRITTTYLIVTNGVLNKPKLPGIPGIQTFGGHMFHTNRWDYDYTGGDQSGGLDKLADKRVAVVGTGATAIQAIPLVAESAQHLFVVQRTPAAVDVRGNRPTDPEWAATLQPGWQSARQDNFNHLVSGIPQDEDLVADGFTAIGRLFDPTASWAAALAGRPLSPEEADYVFRAFDDRKMNEIRARVDEVVEDPATAAALKPWHRRWCKRPLFSDAYLPTFNRENVTLLDTAGAGVERITERGLVVAGQEYEVDCIIFASGFETGTRFQRRVGYDLVGRGGRTLTEHWADGMRTFQGIFTHDFPNCFYVGYGQSAVGPNQCFGLSQQAEHVAYTIAEARRRGATVIEPTTEAVDGYVAEVNPLMISKLQFWKDCTPSFFNDEGATDPDVHGHLANIHPAGEVGFYRMLSQWRDEGALAGLELR